MVALVGISLTNKLQRAIGCCTFLHIGAFASLLLLSSCGTSKKSNATPSKEVHASSLSIEKTGSENQRKFDYFFLEATRKKSLGEFDAAFELYRHCLSIDPESPAVLSEISQYYIFLKQPKKGAEYLEKAVKNDPDNYWYNQNLASLYQQQGDSLKAIESLEKMSIQFPKHQEPLMALLDLYNQSKDYLKAIKILDRLEKSSGKTEQISMEKFRMYLLMADNKRAFKEIENLANEYPNDMRYLDILGDVYLNNGKKKEAFETYQKVLSIEPNNPQAMVSIANYYEQTNQDQLYKQQIDLVLLNKSVDSDIKLDILRQMIAQTGHNPKNADHIVTLFKKIIAGENEDAQVHMLYVQYLLSKGQEKETIPVLEQILAIDPVNVAARLQLLSYAIKKNDFKEAINICEPAIQLIPETIEFYYYLGLSYYQADRVDDAFNTFKKGLNQMGPQSDKKMISDFYSMIGDIYHMRKDDTSAYAAYDSSLVYNPHNTGALNNYAYYLSVNKQNLDKAEELSYRTVKAEPNNGTFLDTYAWILFMKSKYTEAKVYMEDAMKKGGSESDVVTEHYGDVLFMNGDKEGAMKYWIKSKEMGNKSEVLKKKIEKKKYIAE